VAIPASYWNRKTGSISGNLPAEYGDPAILEANLREKLRKAESMVDHALKIRHTCPMRFLKRNFGLACTWKIEQMEFGERKLDVFFQIEQYKLDREDIVKPATITAIGNMKNHLWKFQVHRRSVITFDSFDARFYEGFVKYLTYDIIQMRRNKIIKGLKMKTINQLKRFLKDRMQKKIIPFMDLSTYKRVEEDVDAVFLDWNELSLLFHLDLSTHQNLEKYRDLFVLGCLTGFRFSDYSDIKPEEVRGGMLHVKQKKVLTSIVVPLREDAKKILIDKYNMEMPQVSNPNFNFYIKEVVRIAGIKEPIKMIHKKGNKTIEEIRPKYAWVTSHTCRRSFCTNEYLAETPFDLIMGIGGHKTEKAFRKYIKVDTLKKALMIKKLWDNRPGL
jgi:integrase-like protein